MLGLLDVCHTSVVIHCFRQRCCPRVTDVVVAETARIARNTKIKVQGIVLEQKRGCAHERERERDKKIV